MPTSDAIGVIVNGGTFDGKENIAVIRNVIGTVVINDGKFNAKDSADDFGACVYLSCGSMNVPTITNIKGGTFNAGKCLFCVSVGSSNYTQKINISGGIFNVGEDGDLVIFSTEVTNVKDYIEITGGTFNVDPSAYVAEGYEAVEKDGIWTVQKQAE